MNIFAKTKKIVLFYACEQSIAIAKAFSCKFYKQPHLFQWIITRNGFWWFNFQEYIKCLLNFYWSNQINLCVWLFFFIPWFDSFIDFNFDTIFFVLHNYILKISSILTDKVNVCVCIFLLFAWKKLRCHTAILFWV